MISALWPPIQQHCDRLNDRNRPGVHHYTTKAGALGILRSGCIWFMERAHLNDKREILNGVDIAKRILILKGNKRASEHLDIRAEAVFSEFDFFSASFSLRYDDAYQWEEYADHGKGVALSFRASVFDDPDGYINSLLGTRPNTIICPMSYDSTCLEEMIARIVESWDGSDITELCDYVFMISSMFKEEKWKLENEYRYFIHQRRALIKCSSYHRTITPDGRRRFYLDIPIRNWNSQDDFPIYRICLGPATSNDFEKYLREFVEANHLPIREIGRSQLVVPAGL
jgi:hypothetical protein